MDLISGRYARIDPSPRWVCRKNAAQTKARVVPLSTQ